MGLSDPFRIRLAADHVRWLDSLKTGPITTRAQALRQVLDAAMKADQQQQQARTKAATNA